MSGIEFGVQIEPQYGFTYETIRKIALEAERLGFESIWVSDHFFMTTESVGTSCLECWSTLAALARDTSSLRLGPMVSAQSYRNPALLAKVAATIDNLSGGRLNFGIGAGWKEVEYDAYGYQFPKPSTRIRQLRETVEIANLMWTQDKATFKGSYFSVNEALCFPRPVQSPCIPIWVGGTGRMTLKVAAQHADAINFAWTQPVKLVAEKYGLLRKYCQNVGRDYQEIRKSIGLMLTMADTSVSLEAKLRSQERRRDTEYMRYLARQLPNMAGTPDAIADGIREYIPLGVDHFILRFHFGDEIESMKLFVDEVKSRI